MSSRQSSESLMCGGQSYSTRNIRCARVGEWGGVECQGVCGEQRSLLRHRQQASSPPPPPPYHCAPPPPPTKSQHPAR